jgi:hypothetical protein
LESIYRSYTLCICSRFRTYKIALPPQTKTWGAGGLRHINTCLEVPLLVTFYRYLVHANSYLNNQVLKFCLPSAVFIHMKPCSTIPISARSNLVRRYLFKRAPLAQNFSSIVARCDELHAEYYTIFVLFS